MPVSEVQDAVMPHTRRAFQIDELCTFGSSFAWIAYQLLYMYSAGVIAAGDVFYSLGLLPVVTALVGPRAAFPVHGSGGRGRYRVAYSSVVDGNLLFGSRQGSCLLIDRGLS
jgi:hypothetical protein